MQEEFNAAETYLLQVEVQHLPGQSYPVFAGLVTEARVTVR